MALTRAVRSGDHSQELSDRERAIAAYAAKLTLQPADLSPENIDILRGYGLTDRAILEINLEAAYINFVDRADDKYLCAQGGQ